MELQMTSEENENKQLKLPTFSGEELSEELLQERFVDAAQSSNPLKELTLEKIENKNGDDSIVGEIAKEQDCSETSVYRVIENLVELVYQINAGGDGNKEQLLDKPARKLEIVDDDTLVKLTQGCLDNLVRQTLHYQYMLSYLLKVADFQAGFNDLINLVQKDLKLCESQQKKLFSATPSLMKLIAKYFKTIPAKNALKPTFIDFYGESINLESFNRRRLTQFVQDPSNTLYSAPEIQRPTRTSSRLSLMPDKSKISPEIVSWEKRKSITKAAPSTSKKNVKKAYSSKTKTLFYSDDDSEDFQGDEEEEKDEKEDLKVKKDNENDPVFQRMSLEKKKRKIDTLGFPVPGVGPSKVPAKLIVYTATGRPKKILSTKSIKKRRVTNLKNYRKKKAVEKATSQAVDSNSSETLNSTDQISTSSSTSLNHDSQSTTEIVEISEDSRGIGYSFASLLPPIDPNQLVRGAGHASTSASSIFNVQCRAHGCRFNSDGYPEMAEHETRAHTHGHMVHCDEIGCDELFDDNEKLQEHYRRFHFYKLNKFVCPIDTCKATFSDFPAHKEHCKQFHNDEYRTCTMCSLRFISRARLLFHVSYVHRDESAEVRRELCMNVGDYEMSYPCRLGDCKVSFEKKFDLRKHILAEHENFLRTCKFCRRVFKTATLRMTHVKNIHPATKGTETSCTVKDCNFKAADSNELKKHRYNVHSKPVTCKVEGCGVSMPSIKLGLHMARVHKQRKCVCTWPECDLSFGTNDKLKRHMRVHIRFKKYRCRWPECDYASEERANIAMHVRFRHFKLPRTHKEQLKQCIYSDPALNAYDWVETAQEDLKI